MEIVNSIQHFSTLVKETKQHGKVVFSNCYLMAQEINKYTQNHNMFWEKLNNGLIFLCRERDFYYLYFYLFDIEESAVSKSLNNLDKPVVIDFVFNEKQKQSQLFEVECLWQKSGFKLHDTYSRMFLQGPVHVDKELNIPSGYYLRHTTSRDLLTIENLWRSSLDLFSTALPRREELAKILDEEPLLATYDMYESLVAVMHVITKGKVGIINHVVVSEENRKQGLAKILLHANFLHYDRIEKWYLWVSDKNHSAKIFYSKSGFVFDGIISHQFLLI